jgi:transcription elongation GreA/GreB family factor
MPRRPLPAASSLTTSSPCAPPSPSAVLTPEGRRLVEERVQLLEATVADLGDRLRDSEQRGDVVLAYRWATEELVGLERLLGSAASLDGLPEDPTRVVIGDRVVIRFDDETEETYTVVHAVEASFDDTRISSESPLGNALYGRRVNETVEVAGPAGAYRCTIMSASRGPAEAGG